jgi:hypothetical protein
MGSYRLFFVFSQIKIKHSLRTSFLSFLDLTISTNF